MPRRTSVTTREGCGCLMAPLGLCILLSFVSLYHAATLTCARTAPRVGRCVLVQQSLLGRRSQQLDLGDLVGAVVQRDKESASSAKVVLRTERGDLPMINISETDTPEKHRIADAITAFVNDESAPSLTVTVRPSTTTYLTGLVMSLVALFMLGLSVRQLWRLWRFIRSIEENSAFQRIVPRKTRRNEIGYSGRLDNWP